MQQSCTCQFLVGPGTMKSALAQLAQALVGSEERKVEILYYAKEGTCMPCLIDVVPVKNEEGMVIMFILNYQELIDPTLKKGGLRQKMVQGWVWAGGQNRRLKMRLPSLRPVRRTSLSKEQFEGVPSTEDIPLREFRIPTKESCMHRSRESVHSLRRASSLDDIDSMRAEVSLETPALAALYLKPSTLNSTSDSDLMRHRTVSRIPECPHLRLGPHDTPLAHRD
ncbi:voltage-gated inwardly rectifying potassium channel KCNH6-like [Aplochiton taeniatus]